MKFGKVLLTTAALVGSAVSVVYDGSFTRHLGMDKSQFIEEWDKDGQKCLERSKRGGQMLFPGDMELDRVQQNLFRNVIEHIMEILDEMERDSFRHLAALRDSTRQWKRVSQCLSHYKLIRVEEITDGFVALREVGKGLRKLRWKEGDATTALGDDLLIYTLRLIGFLNTLYADKEVPGWLIDAPGQAVGALLSFLAFDIKQPHGCTLADNI